MKSWLRYLKWNLCSGNAMREQGVQGRVFRKWDEIVLSAKHLVLCWTPPAPWLLSLITISQSRSILILVAHKAEITHSQTIPSPSCIWQKKKKKKEKVSSKQVHLLLAQEGKLKHTPQILNTLNTCAINSRNPSPSCLPPSSRITAWCYTALVPVSSSQL